MENDVLDALTDVGYTGELKDEILFHKAVDEGIKSYLFRDLVVWISNELANLLKLEESVSPAGDEDSSSFLMEISSLLKELGCPFQDLMEGPLTERLSSKEHKLLMLDYLLSELMAARMIRVDRPNQGPELRIQESDTAKALKIMLLSLNFGRPPDNISAAALFSKIEAKLNQVISVAPAELIGKPIVSGRLSTDQWNTLNQLQQELQQEYSLRRDMLLKRLDVTIQSFQWSEKAKASENAVAKMYVEKRNNLKSPPDVDLSDILAAREDLAVIQKTSSLIARKNTQTSIQKVIIGKVPDRGGRPSEQEAPPPEMPSWQKERAQGGGGGGRGGNQFARGGGRVQGGWNDRGQQDQRREDRGGNNQDQRDHRRDDRERQDYRKDGNQDRRSDYHDNRERSYRGGQRGGGEGGRRGGRNYR